MTSGLAQRLIEPELLDRLPVNNPQAIASRRDLVRVNAVMFQGAIMARLLRANLPRKPLRILEIGAGDGSFMLTVARRLAGQWSDVDLVMLDQADLMTAARRAQFAALGWRVQTVTADVFDWMDGPEIGRFDAVTANLFLHHFHAQDLRKLLSAMARLTTLFIATEPRRSRVALWCTGWLWVIGANAVTRHDAAASVRAGFSNSELSQLWPRGTAMGLHERRIGPFTHIFVAGGATRVP